MTHTFRHLLISLAWFIGFVVLAILVTSSMDLKDVGKNQFRGQLGSIVWVFGFAGIFFSWARLDAPAHGKPKRAALLPEFDIRDRPPQALWGKKLHRDSNLPPFYLLSFEISVVARYERIVVSWVPPLSYTPAHVPQAHEVRRPPIRSARGVVSQRSRSATPTHHLHPGPA
jgi:hypothetical protein